MSFKKLLGFNEVPASLEKQNTKYDDYYKVYAFVYNNPEKIFAIGFTSTVLIFSIIMIAIGISLNLSLEWII